MEETRPVHGSLAFTCPHCRAFTQQTWATTVVIAGDEGEAQPWSDIDRATCFVCREHSVWLCGRRYIPGLGSHPSWEMIWPLQAGGTLPHPRLPERLAPLHREAREVIAASPRSAAALLRLLTEDLLQELADPKKKLNENIGQLVREGKLGQQEQRMADYLRISGNSAVHPAQLEVADGDMAARADLMFTFVNLLVEKFIALPAMANEAYAQLPEGAREAIERRDSAPK